MVLYVWLVPLLVWLFAVGAAVGSFLNVCIYRIPLGKSLIWPGSRCGHCFHDIRLEDNIPLVSYWRLGGRCRDCGAVFSMRYFWVELLTAVTFVALYLLDVGLNAPHLPTWPEGGVLYYQWSRAPSHAWLLFVLHALLACFLIVAVGCLLDHGRVPAPVAFTGTLVGVLGAVTLPWPFPTGPDLALASPPPARALYFPADGGAPGRPWRGPMPPDDSWATAPVSPRPGFYAWPVWGPLPGALPAGSWQLGLATGLAGALVGGWGLRSVALTVAPDARRAFATGAADLTMIAGAFLGWQPILVALVLALPVAVPLCLRHRLAPAVLVLLGAVVACWFGWPWVGPVVRPVLFDPRAPAVLLAAWLAVVGAVRVFLPYTAVAVAPPRL